MKLKDLQEHMQTRKWIESEIRHEEHKGIHTFHGCDCGRGYCRSMMCNKCWKEILKELNDETSK